MMSSSIATIASGQTESNEIDLVASSLCGFYVPSNFDGATLTIKASPASGGSFQTVQQGGVDYTLAVTAGKYCPIENLAVVAGLRFIKLVAGSSQSGDSVITLAVRPL